MIKIGIYAKKNTHEITEALILLLKKSDNRVALKSSLSKGITGNIDDESVDYLIIPLESVRYCPIKLDIVIFDCPNIFAVKLCKILNDIDKDTVLIYNSDRGAVPEFKGFNCVDYGFSKDCVVNISSVGSEYGNEKTFTVSVQESFKCLGGESYPISEVMVDCCSDIKLENKVPAVICGLIIGSTEKNQIKM